MTDIKKMVIEKEEFILEGLSDLTSKLEESASQYAQLLTE